MERVVLIIVLVHLKTAPECPSHTRDDISVDTFIVNFGGWGESTIDLLLKIHRYLLQLCNPTTYEFSFVSLRNSKTHLQNDAFILRNLVGNLCDMAYKI